MGNLDQTASSLRRQRSQHSDRQSGGKPLQFILDSGAEASVMDLQTARRLNLELGQPVTVRGINSTTLG
jgi:hypothetical protein